MGEGTQGPSNSEDGARIWWEGVYLRCHRRGHILEERDQASLGNQPGRQGLSALSPSTTTPLLPWPHPRPAQPPSTLPRSKCRVLSASAFSAADLPFPSGPPLLSLPSPDPPQEACPPGQGSQR